MLVDKVDRVSKALAGNYSSNLEAGRAVLVVSIAQIGWSEASNSTIWAMGGFVLCTHPQIP